MISFWVGISCRGGSEIVSSSFIHLGSIELMMYVWVQALKSLSFQTGVFETAASPSNPVPFSKFIKGADSSITWRRKSISIEWWKFVIVRVWKGKRNMLLCSSSFWLPGQLVLMAQQLFAGFQACNSKNKESSLLMPQKFPICSSS